MGIVESEVDQGMVAGGGKGDCHSTVHDSGVRQWDPCCPRDDRES